MPERKPRSQAQRDAQLTAMEAARNAAYRRSEEKARRAREQAERDAAAAAEAERQREVRGGFELGERVTGTERTFNTTRTGTVVEGPKTDPGLYVQDDDGMVWMLNRHTAKGAE